MDAEPTSEELSAAYRQADLKRFRITLLDAMNSPLIYRALRMAALCIRAQREVANKHQPQREAA